MENDRLPYMKDLYADHARYRVDISELGMRPGDVIELYSVGDGRVTVLTTVTLEMTDRGRLRQADDDMRAVNDFSEYRNDGARYLRTRGNHRHYRVNKRGIALPRYDMIAEGHGDAFRKFVTLHRNLDPATPIREIDDPADEPGCYEVRRMSEPDSAVRHFSWIPDGGA